MLQSLLLVAGGLVLLIVASDRLVVSAVRLARSLGVSAVLVGAVVVGLGTSLPEMLVSAIASRDGELDVAMANIVGSNVANITLVLGFAALVSPVVSRWPLLRREGNLMLVSLVALTVVLFDGEVTRTEGIGLAIGLFVALALLTIWSIGVGDVMSVEDEPSAMRSLPVESAYGLVALIVTVAGARILLDGALDIGMRLELSQTFLGVLLGIGTSLPELATAFAAARRRESELVLGNVLGSNIFNSLAVGGIAGIIGPAELVDLGLLPVWLMLVAGVIAGAFSWTSQRVTRLEGLTLIVLFVAFSVGTF